MLVDTRLDDGPAKHGTRKRWSAVPWCEGYHWNTGFISWTLWWRSRQGKKRWWYVLYAGELWDMEEDLVTDSRTMGLALHDRDVLDLWISSLRPAAPGKQISGRKNRTSQGANALNRPTVTSWWFHDAVTARLVVGLSPLRVRWNGIRFHTHSGTLLAVPTASDRRWKLIFFQLKGTISTLEALRDALYKSTTAAAAAELLLLHVNWIILVHKFDLN